MLMKKRVYVLPGLYHTRNEYKLIEKESEIIDNLVDAKMEGKTFNPDNFSDFMMEKVSIMKEYYSHVFNPD